MAQRTGAERLLASPAKGTSAGAALALVLAALLLGGCGGSSAEPGESSSTTSPAAAAQGQAALAEAEPGAQAQGGSQAQGGATNQSPAAPGAGEAPQSAGKHGPRVPQPKGAPEQAPTPAQIANATVADISLTSPSLPPGAGGPAPLPPTYTCDGDGKWPALAWSGVPAGTSELILYAMNIAPVEGQLYVDWAVAGIDPALTGIEAGKLPKGAVVGTNGAGKRGYEICPEGAETYLFALYALPRPLSPEPGFDARELRRRILELSGNVGLYAASYERG